VVICGRSVVTKRLEGSTETIFLGVVLVLILQEAMLRSPKNILSDGYPFRIKEGLGKPLCCDPAFGGNY